MIVLDHVVAVPSRALRVDVPVIELRLPAIRRDDEFLDVGRSVAVA